MPVPAKSLLEDFQVRVSVVIGDDDFRVEGPNRVGSFVGRHGVGEIHADEGDVDVLEGAHLGDAFGVGGEVEALASVGEDVAIVASLGMVELSGGGAAREVVGGDGFDGPLLPLAGLMVGDGFGGGKLFDDRGGSEDLRGGLAEGRDGFGIEVIGVNVGDQNEVGFGKSGELCGLGRIDVDGFASGLNERAGVVERSDLHVSGGGGESLCLGGGEERSAEGEQQHRFHARHSK